MLLHVLKSALTFLLVIAIFNLMIIVHELGHFLAAKWRGLIIEEFGVWFGKALWKKKIGGVWYSLGTIPFGGFVKLPQLAEMAAFEGKSENSTESLPPISPLSKTIVAFAGPLFSFLLAAAFAVIVWQVGRPVSESEATTVIGAVEPGSPAAEVGLQPGDKILSIDGNPVKRWNGMGKDSITWLIVSSEGETLEVDVQRGDKTIHVSPKPKIPPTRFWERKSHRQLQIIPKETPLIGKVQPGTPAADAKLQAGDRILKINDREPFFLGDISTALDDNPSKPIHLTIGRPVAGGKEIQTIEATMEPAHDAVVVDTIKDSPAEKAGVKAGDHVTKVNGDPYVSLKKFTELITKNGVNPVKLSIERDGKPLEFTMTPTPPEGQKDPKIGVEWHDDQGWEFDGRGITSLSYPSPVEQIKKAGMSIFETIGAIASRKSNVGIQHMSGPVMMMRAYYTFLQLDDGWRLVFWFSVILNVNLAILNMLPIPPLDGSHITLAIVEAIRRRPANAHIVRVVEIVQTACTIAIIAFMLYIMSLDVQDLSIFHGDGSPKFSGHTTPSAAAASPAPAKPQ